MATSKHSAKRPPTSNQLGNLRLTGAREHHLKDLTIEIPSGSLTVFTGVSGSGKSSLVFDTIAVEAARQLADTFGAHIRQQLPRYERPQVDSIENLTAAVVVDQRPMGANARSTVGTASDVGPLLRVLFSRLGTPTAPAGVFSFNDPQGWCPQCEGLGQSRRVDVEAMLDRNRSLNEGAIQLATHKVGGADWQLYANSGHFDLDKTLQDYSVAEWEMLTHGTGPRVTVKTKNSTAALDYEGVVARFARVNLKRDLSGLSERGRRAVERFITIGTCVDCAGARLSPAALASTINGRSIGDWCRLDVTQLYDVVGEITDSGARAMVERIQNALRRIIDIGLGYLSLDRAIGSLSGGEAQRLKMVRHLGSSLTHLTYVFDEPSAGLHPRDVQRVGNLLRELRDAGNTVLVVEHDPDVIALADHVIDLGPAAGRFGGEIVFEGTYSGLKRSAGITGRQLRAGPPVLGQPREPQGKLPVSQAAVHNLSGFDVAFPAGVLTVVTGVAGSGKSSLVSGAFLAAYPEATYVDQAPIRAASRSVPLTYLEVMDPLRTCFAKATKTSAGDFSFNSTGACGTCQGRGQTCTEVAYMDPVTQICPDCEGRRFHDDVLARTMRGKSIADVLDLSAAEAVDYFDPQTEAALLRAATTMVRVGLGYLTLGQSLATLSGGERQRLKLAAQIDQDAPIIVLDEPTNGLHLADVRVVLTMLDDLVDSGRTVVVVEHNLDVVARADWVIDLGPEGGAGGGQLMFEGPPQDLIRCEQSATGQHLADYIRA